MRLDLIYTGALTNEMRRNLEKIGQAFRELTFEKGKFRHIEIDIPSAVTNMKYPHHMGFKPLDVIQTSLTGAGNLTWNYDGFDNSFVDITTTDACKVRAFLGTYKEQSDA